MKTAERLQKLKEEREKLLMLSQSINPDNTKKPFFGFLNNKAKEKVAQVAPKEKEVPAIKQEKQAEKKEEIAKKESQNKEKKQKPAKKDSAGKKSIYEQKKFFSSFIRKAGVVSDFDDINKKIMLIALIIIGSLSVFLIVDFIISQTFLSDALIFLFSLWVLGGVILYLVLWGVFFVYVDLKIDKRRKDLEAVFPDFLQLTAANINAGMPIDRALWFAIRPRFGILAKEMEDVAKATMVGENLSKALTDFSNKYDSITIKRSLNLLLEGLESGGEVGGLLIKVATNLRETEIMKKEMSSNVTTYVIFILFATLGAAPFLFGLTTELIVIMSSIMSSINLGESTQSFGGIGSMLSKGGTSVSVSDYQIFAITSICLSCIFASIIISVIQKGDAKEAFKKIPLYVPIGIALYFIAFKALNLLLGGFFA